MKAAQEAQEEKKELATARQMVKVLQLIADQKPTIKGLQKAMRLIPNLLQAQDLDMINRFDFCRMIGTPTPFDIYESDISLKVDYETPLSELFLDLASKGIRVPETWSIKHTKDWPGKRRKCLLISRCDYERYDLGIANVRELITFAKMLSEYKVRVPFEKFYVDGGWSSRIVIENHQVTVFTESCDGSLKEPNLLLVRRLTKEEQKEQVDRRINH